MKRNSRENTTTASKRNGIRVNPHWERRNQGPISPRVPPQKKPEEATSARNSHENTA